VCFNCHFFHSFVDFLFLVFLFSSICIYCMFRIVANKLHHNCTTPAKTQMTPGGIMARSRPDARVEITGETTELPLPASCGNISSRSRPMQAALHPAIINTGRPPPYTAPTTHRTPSVRPSVCSNVLTISKLKRLQISDSGTKARLQPGSGM